jgi:1-acyl-sn-glycerol-3-phosphate acyltransferase
MSLADFVFVDRRKREAAQAAVDRAADLLRKGLSFLVFPEGTRSKTGKLQAFKKGAFVLSIKGRADIIPVLLRGSHLSMPKGAWAVKPGKVSVTILDPIPTEGLTYIDRDRLLEKAHNAMARALFREGC